MSITFRRFEMNDLRILRRWFEDDELAQRLSYPSAEWFRYITEHEEARCWVGLSGDEPVVVIQVDGAAGESGYLDIALCPALRGRGLGSLTLTAFLAGPGRAYPRLIGSIEPNNQSSLACCRRCGFALAAELDDDGLVRATYDQSGVASQKPS